MQELLDLQLESSPTFVDRRSGQGRSDRALERRQFRDSRTAQRPEVTELAEAIDNYKLLHRRRFITFEEMYDVIVELGYRRDPR
jgi:hypothetical protein